MKFRPWHYCHGCSVFNDDLDKELARESVALFRGRDLPAAWETATPEQRNDLARLVFQSIEVQNDRVVAVVPQPDFTPFFAVKAADDGMGGGNENGTGGTDAVNRETEEAEATGVGTAC
ncbi:MAG: hypothetical protein M3121_03175 [Chloroflexota bacterium]|nr:hypothetical protein [Chloroflexota bacterium]